MAYLDHDHRKRENIRFFAIRPLIVQDLRRGPSRSMNVITKAASHGIQVLSDGSKTEICDPRVPCRIHEDI